MSSGTQPTPQFSKTGALDTKATAFWAAGVALALGYTFFPALVFLRELVPGVSTLSFVDIIHFRHGSRSTSFIQDFPLITSMMLLMPMMWLLFAWGAFRTRTCQYTNMLIMTAATVGLAFLCLAGYGEVQDKAARGNFSAGSAWLPLLVAIGALVRAEIAYINEFLSDPPLGNPSDSTASAAPRAGFGAAFRDLRSRAWDYTTRTSRSGYWYGLLVLAAIAVPSSYVIGALGSTLNDRMAIVVTTALPQVFGIIGTGISVRRFHDIGWSGVLPVLLLGVSFGYVLSFCGLVAINGSWIVPDIAANLVWVTVPLYFLGLGITVFAGLRPGIDGPVGYSAN